jgi:uncharacterized membrane protein HdeD (DUF308 family)
MTETSTTNDSGARSSAERPAASSGGGSDPTGWWVLATVGSLSIVVGVAMFVWPDATLRVLALLVGIWVLFAGIARILGAFLPGSSLGRQLLSGIVGVLLVIAGVACLRDLVKALALLAVIIALTWMLSGLAWVVLGAQTTGPARAWLLAVGILSIIIGVVILVWPELSLTALLYLTAATAFVVGAGELRVAFQLRKASTGQPG